MGGASQAGVTGGVQNGGSGWGGSSAGPQPLPYVKSGKRLKATGYVADGAYSFTGFEDTDWGPCQFARHGKHMACLPAQQVELLFLDARCSEAATWFLPNGEVGQPVSVRQNDSDPVCSGDFEPRSAYRIGERVYEEAAPGDASRAELYQLGAQGCEPARHWGKIDPPVHRLEPMADSELVLGQLRSIELHEHLGITRLEMEDGAALTVGVTTTGGKACSVLSNSECVPTPLASLDVPFANANCNAFTWNSNFGVCGTAEYAVLWQRGEPHIHTLVPAPSQFTQEFLPPDSSSVGLRYECRPVEPPSEFAMQPGQEVTGMFAAKQGIQAVRLGQAELRSGMFAWREPTSGELWPLVPEMGPGQFSFENGRPCRVVPGADGTLRCAPIGNLLETYFADAECTRRVYQIEFTNSGEPAEHPEWLGVAEYTNDGQGLVATYDIRKHEGPTYVKQGESCLAMLEDQTEYWEKGQRTELEALPLVERTTF